jgi:ankyrin repeat protein
MPLCQLALNECCKRLLCWTPLHCAVSRHDVATVIHLLSLGAAADILDRRGETALSTETSLAPRGAAKHPSWLKHRPWVP